MQTLLIFKKTVHNMTFVVTLVEKALILELSVVYESLSASSM